MYRPLDIRRLKKTVALATAAAALLAGVTLTQPVEAADGLPAGTLSQYVGFNQYARFQHMETALGRPLDRVVTIADHRSPSAMRSSVWGQFISSTAYLPKVSNRVDVTVTVPLAFGQNALYQTAGPQAVLKNLQQTISGAHDTDYQVVARNLIRAGFPDAVIRLGHEFDGTYYPWSARDNEQKYIEAFRHVHDVFAKESSSFKFDWTGMNATWRAHAQKAYPGDAYVDIIGLDSYYRTATEITDLVWARYKATLIAQRDFAISRGKPVSFPEWGRAFGDTDRFIVLMHGWFSGLPKSGPGRLAYQSYFNPPELGGNYDLNKQPNVKRRYLQLFSSVGSATADVPVAQPTATALLTTAPPTTAPPTSLAPVSTPPVGPSIALVPRVAALELTWFYPGDERRNVRYRAAGSTKWTWVANGAWKQVISGLRSGTGYEVQARAFVNGAWQPWLTATATTR